MPELVVTDADEAMVLAWQRGEVGPSFAHLVAAARAEGFAAGAAEEREAAHGPVLARIAAERARQDAKWGDQNHDPAYWAAILCEETGEVAKAALDKDWGNYPIELIQCAAVCVAAYESAIRNRGSVVSGLLASVRAAIAADEARNKAWDDNNGAAFNDAIEWRERLRGNLDLPAIAAALEEAAALRIENARLTEDKQMAWETVSQVEEESAALRTDLAALRGRAERLHAQVRRDAQNPMYGGITGTLVSVRCRACNIFSDENCGWDAVRHLPDCPAAPDFLSGNGEGVGDADA